MDDLTLEDWIISVGVERTRDFYASLPCLSCDCGDCQNFIAAYDGLPDEVRSIFASLEIDPRKDGGEVYSCVHHDDGSIMYGDVMLFVEEIAREPREPFFQFTLDHVPTVAGAAMEEEK